MKRYSFFIFIVTTFSSIDHGLVSCNTWDSDCTIARYVPATQSSLTFLQDEYHRKFGPPPETRPNEVKVSEISEPKDSGAGDVMCGTRAGDWQGGENFTAGGTEESSFPWVVAVQGSKHFCAGVLLTVNFVLSPARCVDATAKVVMGIRNRMNITSKSQTRLSIANYFNNAAKLFQQGFDIGLIKLDRPAEYSETVRPICLPAAGSEFHFYNCYLLNWGLYDPVKKELSDDLLVLPVEIMESDECQFRYKLVQQRVNESEVCLGFKQRTGALSRCTVDSGGPVLCEVRGRSYVAAMTSHVESGCANRLLPDIFTKVATFENWIAEKLYIK